MVHRRMGRRRHTRVTRVSTRREQRAVAGRRKRLTMRAVTPAAKACGRVEFVAKGGRTAVSTPRSLRQSDSPLAEKSSIVAESRVVREPHHTLVPASGGPTQSRARLQPQGTRPRFRGSRALLRARAVQRQCETRDGAVPAHGNVARRSGSGRSRRTGFPVLPALVPLRLYVPEAHRRRALPDQA